MHHDLNSITCEMYDSGASENYPGPARTSKSLARLGTYEPVNTYLYFILISSRIKVLPDHHLMGPPCFIVM